MSNCDHYWIEEEQGTRYHAWSIAICSKCKEVMEVDELCEELNKKNMLLKNIDKNNSEYNNF